MTTETIGINSAPLATPVHLILLALLEGPAHGYHVMKNIEAITEGMVALGPASVYTNLNKCLQSKLIKETSSSAVDERRRTYQITAKGKSLLVAETNRLANLVNYANKHIR